MVTLLHLALISAAIYTHTSAQNWGYQCVYTTPSPASRTLDLCHYPINGIVIEAYNAYNHYLYTPANRSFYSPQDETHYSLIRIDNNDETNITYLSPSVSLQPISINTYDEWTFLFEYSMNNPSCPNNNEKTNIYWQCNSSITNYPYYYDIISSGFIYPCTNVIFIQSPLACSSSLQPPIMNYDCTFTKNIEGQTFVLNLTRIGGVSASPTIYYTHCRNTPTPYGSTKTSRQYSMIRTNTIVWGTFDMRDIIEPTYDINTNVWSFTLSGGSNECVEYFTTIHWNCSCDYAREYYAQGVTDLQSCLAEINVSANSICLEGECNPNDTDCVYEYQVEPNQWISLNLTELQGQTIERVENNGRTAFTYNPCDNVLTCNGLEIMAGRIYINDSSCIDDLAKFDGVNGFKVDYEGNEWMISYANGQQCNDDNMEFITYWTCLPSVDWAVSYANFTDDCVYVARIQSKYACS